MSSYYMLIWANIRHLVGGMGEDSGTMVEVPFKYLAHTDYQIEDPGYDTPLTKGMLVSGVSLLPRDE